MDIKPRGVSSAMDRINAVYAGRKGALSSALASRRFQMGIVPVPIPCPEVALDVDELADYRLVSEILSRGSAP